MPHQVSQLATAFDITIEDIQGEPTQVLFEGHIFNCMLYTTNVRVDMHLRYSEDKPISERYLMTTDEEFPLSLFDQFKDLPIKDMPLFKIVALNATTATLGPVSADTFNL